MAANHHHHHNTAAISAIVQSPQVQASIPSIISEFSDSIKDKLSNDDHEAVERSLEALNVLLSQADKRIDGVDYEKLLNETCLGVLALTNIYLPRWETCKRTASQLLVICLSQLDDQPQVVIIQNLMDIVKCSDDTRVEANSTVTKIIAVKLFDLILQRSSSCQKEILSDDFKEQLFEIISTKILSCDTSAGFSVIVSSTLPLLLQGLSASESTFQVKLDTLFNIIETHSRSENPEHAYTILCTLADFFLPSSGTLNSKTDIRNNATFWEILQNGLCNDVTLTRKRSMYLIKRALDLTSTSKSPFLARSAEGFSLFYWAEAVGKELDTIWQELVLLMETLEEKQTHMMKPILGRVDRLIEASNTIHEDQPLLHASWVGVVFRRAFQHESLQIKKWGAQCCLSSQLTLSLSFTDFWQSFVCVRLLTMLNDTSLLGREHEELPGSYPKLAESLKAFFQSCVVNLNKANRDSFFHELMVKITDIHWSEVPLFYMCWAFSHLGVCGLWGTEEVLNLRNFLMSGHLAFFDVRIRSGILCLMCESVINLMDTSEVSFEVFVYFLSSLGWNECLTRGTALWEKCARWLQQQQQNGVWDSEEIAQFLKKCLTTIQKGSTGDSSDLQLANIPSVFPKILLLLCDSGILSLSTNQQNKTSTTFQHFLQPVLETINSMNHRAYMAAGKAENCLLVMTNLIRDIGMVNRKGLDDVQGIVGKLCSGCVGEVVLFVGRKVTTKIKELEDLKTLMLCEDALTQLNKASPDLMIKLCTDDLLPSLGKVLNSELNHSQESTLRCLAGLHVLASVCKFTSKKSGQLHQSLLKLVSKVDISVTLKKDPSLSQADWGRVVDMYLQAQWTCLQYALTHSWSPEGYSPTELVNQALETLNLSSQKCTPVVFRCLKFLLAQIDDDDDLVCSVIDITWRKVLENGTSQHVGFWACLETYLQLTFQPKFLNLETSSENVYEKVHKCAMSLLQFGEDKKGVANSLVSHLAQYWLREGNIRHTSGYIDVLVYACTVGAMNTRRIIKEALDCIHHLGKDFTTNQIFGSTSSREFYGVRAVIHSLVTQQHTSSEWKQFRATFLQQLVDKHKVLMQDKAFRNFPNTGSSRIKHRVITTIMVLEPTVDEANVDDFFTYIMDSLHIEQQTTIRYYLEWMAIRILYRFPRTHPTFWEYFKQDAQKKKISAVCSLMCVVAHACQVLDVKQQQEEFLSTALPLVLPWCMAHHFNSRLFAQVTLYKLWQVVKENNLQCSEAEHIKASVDFILTTGKNARIAQKLLEHFFFFKFHPLRDFSIQTIFDTLPQLLGMADDERIAIDVFEDMDQTWTQGDHHHYIVLNNPSQELDTCTPGPWIINSECDVSAGGPDGDFQKKIMPWRSMIPDVDAKEQLQYESLQRRTGRLVVVASLIDKPPNLGGLCRTSEIFNVSEFVVGSLKVLDDKVFQSLSVTAQKWLPIKEVYAESLKIYLQEMKDSGYTLVGVEQTANSKELTHYEFPVKTLLLLGRERTGIPVDLIQLLDVCVEIPQQGIIRSLNVHVSGALLIWEYTRQQLLKDAKN